MTWPVDVLVAVPAHNEEDRIASCLRSVAAAARVARSSGQVRRVRVVVGAHRCADATIDIARGIFAEQTELHGLVAIDHASETVGGVRRATITAALAWPWYAAPLHTWIFNTDADSSVPPDWIASSLLQAHRSGAVAAVGLVRLDAWTASNRARRAYEELLAAGMHPGGHSHVYGANLAVRLDAYLDVGGFEFVEHGEDHALIRELRSAGWPIRTTTEPVVTTAGRVPGRAAHGLAGLLHSLASHPPLATRPVAPNIVAQQVESPHAGHNRW